MSVNQLILVPMVMRTCVRRRLHELQTWNIWEKKYCKK